MKKSICFVLGLSLWYACQTPEKKPIVATENSVISTETIDSNRIALRAASNFELTKHEHIQNAYYLEIFKPWTGATTSAKYVLVPKEELAKIRFMPPNDVQLIAYPIENIVCTSTIQAAMLNKLGLSDKIVAMTEGETLYDADLYAKVQSGKILDLGSNQQVNYEKLMTAQPELMLIFGMNAPSRMLSKLQEMQVSHLYMAEYLETSPVGRAEWIKILGILFGKGDMANDIFEKEIFWPYNALAKDAKMKAVSKTRPKVLTGIAHEGQWFVAGGQSLMAKMIADAQGDYLYASDTNKGSMPYAFEKVYMDGANATIWLDVWQAKNKADLAKMNANYTKLTAYRQDAVFSYLKRVSQNGGYDIFESAIVQPHLLLKDLVTIFHSDKLSNDSLYYYQRLQ